MAVAVFGGMSYKDDQTTIDSTTSRFEWGFYLGIPGALLPILAGLFYVIESKRYEGYERGVRNDVVWDKDQLLVHCFYHVQNDERSIMKEVYSSVVYSNIKHFWTWNTAKPSTIKYYNYFIFRTAYTR